MGVITYNGIINYLAKSYYDPGNAYEGPSRTMVCANITWSSPNEKYFVTLFGENLTGEEYNTSQADGGWRIAGPPRQVYLKAGVNF